MSLLNCSLLVVRD